MSADSHGLMGLSEPLKAFADRRELIPRPPTGSKKWSPPQFELITKLGKLEDY